MQTLPKDKITEITKVIYNYSRLRTASGEETEDLSQEILLELIKAVPNLRDHSAFYSFMWSVAGNVYKQWCRKRASRKECELPEDLPFPDDPFAFDEDSDVSLLRRELSLLAKKYRQAVVLYYLENRSCTQISDALSISESMVKYLLFKSRKLLKEGMHMERKLGTLSYNPKTLIPMYSGTGPNHFWDFLQSKVRQNIVCACYNDALTVEQISLEIGVALPYIEEDIDALTDKQILVKKGNLYSINVILITKECADEIDRASEPFYEEIAVKIASFLDKRLDDYRNIGFAGAHFSENTLRWQLATLVFRAAAFYNFSGKPAERPVTAWGDRAFLWCVEQNDSEGKCIFRYSGMDGKNGNSLYFFDYVPLPKGDHHDFFGNDRKINLYCDIARGQTDHFSEYDLETIAEMVREGYIRNDGGKFTVTVPVYTAEQYAKARSLAEEFIKTELASVMVNMYHVAAKILSAHTPKHLQHQVDAIARHDSFLHTVCIPAMRMVESRKLIPSWHPLEMPTTYIVLSA